MTSRPSEAASTPTPCGMIEKMSRAIFARSVLVQFLLLTPPISHIRHPECAASLWVGMVIINIKLTSPI
jgi:hypothetical protein